jgi:hypothetical protein
MISGRIRELELDVSHFHGSLTAQIEAIPTEALRSAAVTCLSVAQMCTRFGFAPKGRSHDRFSKRLDREQIDTSHFRGSGWSRGDTAATDARVAAGVAKRSLPDEVVFSENSPYVTSSGPKPIKRLLSKGWVYACAICGISDWLGEPLVLHLDHKNGIHNDNRLVNLRLLCPNCHSQTDTYCNRTRASRASERRAAVEHSCYTERARAWRNGSRGTFRWY